MIVSYKRYRLYGRHPDFLLVMQRGIKGPWIVVKSRYSYFITVKKGHCYGIQGWCILKKEKKT